MFMVKEVIESREVPISEVESILEQRSGSAQTYEQQVALEHAKRVSGKPGEKLADSLRALNIVGERSVIKILEIMPRSPMTLRQILASERNKTFDDKEIAQIMELIKGKAK